MRLYYVVPTGRVLCGADGSANDQIIPKISFGEFASLEIQFLNTENTGTDGKYNDRYLGYASSTLAASASVNDSFNWYDAAKLKNALTQGTGVSTLVLAYAPSDSIPRVCGKLLIGEETVYYNNLVKGTDGTCTLTLSDSDYATAEFVPAASHAANAAVLVYPARIIKTPSYDIDLSQKATGLFIVPLNARNIILGNMIEGEEGISGLVFELKLFSGGLPVCIMHCGMTISSVIDLGGAGAANPDIAGDDEIKTYYGPTLTVASGATISSLRCCYSTSGGAAVLTSSDVAHAGSFAGISLNAAEAEAAIVLLVSGIMEDASWSWTPGASLFIGSTGALTATAPSTGFSQQIATAITATKIVVNAQTPIIIEE